MKKMKLKFTEVPDDLFEEKHPIPEQHGPLRFYDREMRCARRGCSSSTYLKVNGIPRCMMHALRELNDILSSLDESMWRLDGEITE